MLHPRFARPRLWAELLERRDTPAYDPFGVDVDQLSATDYGVEVIDGDPVPGDGVEDTAGVICDIYYNGAFVETIASPDLTFTLGPLPAGTRVYVDVYAYDFDGGVSNSVPVEFDTDTAGTVAVAVVSTGTTSGQAGLTSDITTDWTYYITDDAGNYYPYITTTDTLVDFVELTPATTYHVYVEGINGFGDVIQSNVAAFTAGVPAPAAVTLGALATGRTSATVTWSSPLVTEWSVYLSSGGTYSEVTRTTGNSVNLPGLTPGATYSVYVDGLDPFGTRAFSNVATFTTDPPPGAVTIGGAADGAVRLVAADGSATTATPFGTSGTPTRTATADVNGDGVADVVAVTGAGPALRVAVLSGADGSVLVAPFDPFGGNFAGGGYVAAGDLNGDGRAEFAVTPDQGGGPRVTVFSLSPDGTTTVRHNFLGIDDANFRGGARAAIGDVNGDGTPDLIVAAGFGGGPRVAVFEGKSVLAGAPVRLVSDFFAFPGTDATNLRNGAFVAAGDINGDGFAELVFGGGPGGAPRVFILSGALVSAGKVGEAQTNPVANFFAGGNPDDRGGARVAVTNSDGDGKADLAVGSGAGRPAKVRVYLGKDFVGGGEPPALELEPFGGAVLADGVYVG